MWLTIRAILRILWDPIKEKFLNLWEELRQTPKAVKRRGNSLARSIKRAPSTTGKSIDVFLTWFDEKVAKPIIILAWKILFWPYYLLRFVCNRPHFTDPYPLWINVDAQNMIEECSPWAGAFLTIASCALGIRGFFDPSYRCFEFFLIPLILSVIRLTIPLLRKLINRFRARFAVRLKEKKQQIVREETRKATRITPSQELVRPADAPTDNLLRPAQTNIASNPDQLLRPSDNG